MTHTPLFTPSTTDLLDMIASAERKCDLDIEATQNARMERALIAQAKARAAKVQK